MTDFIWYRNAELDQVAYQPDTARAMLAQAGWFPLSAEEVAEREQAALDAAAAAERAMQATRAVSDEPAPGSELPHFPQTAHTKPVRDDESHTTEEGD